VNFEFSVVHNLRGNKNKHSPSRLLEGSQGHHRKRGKEGGREGGRIRKERKEGEWERERREGRIRKERKEGVRKEGR